MCRLSTCEQADDFDSNSETESCETISEDSIIWSSDEDIVDSDSDDNREDGRICEGLL